jgi:hypothetical protein
MKAGFVVQPVHRGRLNMVTDIRAFCTLDGLIWHPQSYRRAGK